MAPEDTQSAGPTDYDIFFRLKELRDENPELGYRAAHAALQAEEAFAKVSLKKVQTIFRDVKESPDSNAKHYVPPPPAAPRPKITEEVEVTVKRPDTSLKFGMVIDSAVGASGGHVLNEVKPTGALEVWNKENADNTILKGDVLLAVNGETTFDGMMGELKSKLEATIRVRRVREAPPMVLDSAEAEKEKAAWEERRARVTAALIPGLKKIIESEFGPGAGEKIGRVEEMYKMVGRNEVFESEGEHGKRYAPGYIAGLEPIKPFHRPQDHSWCAELRTHWKAIRKELRASTDESLWCAGAYASSNEAYGKDWKILPVLTEDKWQDEARFKITTQVLKSLPGVKPFEAFFARMPPRTEILPHSDNLSYVLTSHLALELEEGKCSITVGNETKHWKEGEMIMLDTTFIHSTKNESSKPRYVLVFRFWHPQLTEEERRAIHVSHAILAAAKSGK
mmetsp:Transcript_71342/g.149114  ORF Transcript_71342/g.149114 Transcript_71342/m.149114 type:complete len:451 (-) Transcript_71342:31-1383(-)|eukprot:CAMPEP_0206574528 /NCGR_PEP_ID=MMETSP0325_2-20121206/29504_1 /ASSEMBLY_ACC=CAM_ASM_000347 /TAXON_ID=2866 /ORGANISM="Crypthecodinium cohnii, Strain Seligo" /LENGTH=450 /DNA_ID=CAMNT_0054079159 /DNA_START=124 /DNA_END=1476 /DNA_ORIENTATION=+